MTHQVKAEASPPAFHFHVANGQLAKRLASAHLIIEIGDTQFHEEFIFMKHVSTPIKRLSFSGHNNAVFEINKVFIHFPHLTVTRKTEEKHITYKPKNAKIQQALTIPPKTTSTRTAHVNTTHQYHTTGIITPTQQYKGRKIKIANWISTVRGKEKHTSICNLKEHPYILKTSTTIVIFQVLSLEQTKQLEPIDTAALSVQQQDNYDQTSIYINELLKIQMKDPTTENIQFSTPENPGNKDQHNTFTTKRLRRIIQSTRTRTTDSPRRSTMKTNIFR